MSAPRVRSFVIKAWVVIGPKDPATPILFCSGALNKCDIDAARLAGAQGYIGKPFDPDELIEALRRAISTKWSSVAIETAAILFK